jgi:hypothetical protein
MSALTVIITFEKVAEKSLYPTESAKIRTDVPAMTP